MGVGKVPTPILLEKVMPVLRRNPDGLKPLSVRILRTLLKARGPVRPEWIASHAPCEIAWVSDHLGRVDPDIRAAREAKTGYPSLTTRGYVESVILDIDGRSERGYRLTPAGREFAKSLPEPPPESPDLPVEEGELSADG